MNKKTLGLLKIAYSKVMSVPPVEMAAGKYKDSKKAKKIKAYNAYLLSLYGTPGSTSLDQTSFTAVKTDYKSVNGYSAGFDIGDFRNDRRMVHLTRFVQRLADHAYSVASQVCRFSRKTFFTAEMLPISSTIPVNISVSPPIR